MKTCILTLDFINDICNEKGKIARYANRIADSNTIGNANRVIQWGRQKNHLIAHVKLGFRATYKDISLASPLFSQAKKNDALKLNTWGTQFCDELDITQDDIPKAF